MRNYSTTAGEMVLQSGVAAGDTTVVVDTTAGLPVMYPYTLLLDYGSISEEVVDVTAAAGTSLTVVRGRDGTVAQSHPFGAKIRHGVTARDYRESREHEAATAAHGVTTVAGLVEAQTLDNKTFHPDGDHAAVELRPVAANTAPLADVRDESDARVAGWFEQGLKTFFGANPVLTAFQGGAVNLYKSILELRVSDDINALTGKVSGTPTGRFLRLMNGATELFSVAGNGDLKAGAADLTSVTASGAVSGSNITTMASDIGTHTTRLDGLDTTVAANRNSSLIHTGTSGAKRVHMEQNAGGSTDASGFMTVPHSAGFTPSGVMVMMKTPSASFAYAWGSDTYTGTTVRLRFGHAGNGSVFASGSTGPLTIWLWE